VHISGIGPIKFANRDTYLISPAGKVAKVWTGVNPSTHSGEVLADLEAEKK
jgi:peroxiredoxin Q/BCP